MVFGYVLRQYRSDWPSGRKPLIPVCHGVALLCVQRDLVCQRKLSVSIRDASLWFSLVCCFSSAQNKGDLVPWAELGSWKES